MLVLSRKANQRIMIGDSIEVVVLSVRNGNVKLGFKAPHDVPIHREESYRRVAIQLREPLLSVQADVIASAMTHS